MSLCDNQRDFNVAFKEALKNVDKTECTTTECKVWVVVVVILSLLFIIWAVILALRVSDNEHRILHLVMAILFSPLYVVSYYCSMFL